jgi:hypothetical protein
MCSRYRFAAAALALIVFQNALAAKHDDWTNLNSLKPGDKVGIIQSNQKRIKGVFQAATETSISIRSNRQAHRSTRCHRWQSQTKCRVHLETRASETAQRSAACSFLSPAGGKHERQRYGYSENSNDHPQGYSSWEMPLPSRVEPGHLKPNEDQNKR